MWKPPAIPPLDAAAEQAARARQAQLTKPAGALGALEDLACRLAGIQGRMLPSCERAAIVVFAGDHGVAARGVSAYPQAVTAQMLATFARGGAAIAVLARQLGASLRLVDAGVASALEPGLDVVSASIAPGTRDLASTTAMDPEHCAQALALGEAEARRACDAGCEVFIPGEMGIGNSCSAAAILACLGDWPLEACVGRGSGIDDLALARKQQAVAAARQRHHGAAPLAVLAGCGGFEIAALVGAILHAASRRRAVLIDGFIVSVAALLACRLAPDCRPYLVFAHRGAEPGHRLALEALQAEPLLALGLRLGEASGAALALPLLRAACTLLAEMATFAEAGVSGPAAEPA